LKLETSSVVRYPLEEMRARAVQVYNDLLEPICSRGKIVGSILRERPMVKDIDLLLIPTVPVEEIANAVRENCVARRFYASGGDRLFGHFIFPDGEVRTLNLFFTTADSWGAASLYSVGSWQFNTSLRSYAKRWGYLLSEKGLFKPHDPPHAMLPSEYEEDICHELRLPWVPPALRIPEEDGPHKGYACIYGVGKWKR
jgi:DNA polymerase/3'-5' exonuclease PolX